MIGEWRSVSSVVVGKVAGSVGLDLGWVEGEVMDELCCTAHTTCKPRSFQRTT